MITYKKRFFSRASAVTKTADGRYTIIHDAGTFTVDGGTKLGGSKSEWFLAGPTIADSILCTSVLDALSLLETI